MQLHAIERRKKSSTKLYKYSACTYSLWQLHIWIHFDANELLLFSISVLAYQCRNYSGSRWNCYFNTASPLANIDQCGHSTEEWVAMEKERMQKMYKYKYKLRSHMLVLYGVPHHHTTTTTTLQPIFHQMHFIINNYVSFIDHVLCIASTFNIHKRVLHIFWISFTQNDAFHAHTPGCVYYRRTFEMSKVLNWHWIGTGNGFYSTQRQQYRWTSHFHLGLNTPWHKHSDRCLNKSPK